MSRKPTVLHVITSLGPGGAQSGMIALIQRLQRYRHVVVSLTALHPYGDTLQTLGVGVTSAHVDKRPLTGLHQIAATIGRERPDVIHCWLHHADVLGGLFGRIFGVPVIWHLHVGTLERSLLPRSTKAFITACRLVSRDLPDHIVACSESSARAHRELGYYRASMRVIANGVDTERFMPRSKLRCRSNLAIPTDAFVIGIIARRDPQKDIGTFLNAAAFFHRRITKVHFVIVGSGFEASNGWLHAELARRDLVTSTSCLGVRSDLEEIYPALDIFSLSSVSEGLSMSLLEAMACGVIPAVTDVGDASLVVRHKRLLVPPRNPRALAAAWRSLHGATASTRRKLGQVSRDRVVKGYSVTSYTAAFDRLYRRVIRQLNGD